MGQASYKSKTIYSKEVQGPSNPGESSIFIHPESSDFQENDLPSKARTLYESFMHSANKWPNNNCLGTFIKTENQCEYKWKCYSSVLKKVLKIGYGLDCLKLTTSDNTGYSYLGIYSNNRAEWILMDLACMSQSIVSIPLYDIHQSESLIKIIDETEMRGLACSYKLLKNIYDIKSQGRAKSLTIIIVFEKIQASDRQTAEVFGINLVSLKKITKLRTSGTPNPPSTDTWLTICYTSGTAGVSNGAIISHKNMMTTLSGVYNSKLRFFHSDIHFSYLPLAHIFERAVSHYILSLGASIGFYRGDISTIIDDMSILRPTVFISVPRIFKRFYDKIQEVVNSTTGPKKKIIQRAIKVKLRNYDKKGKITHKIWDKLVMKKFQTIIGGRVRVMITGSAPIASEIIRFLRVCFSCIFIEGYGQTEVCSASTVTNINDTSLGHVGGPLPLLELKLVDVPEMGYKSEDLDDHGNKMPRGEICLRGPAVFSGYYKSSELNSLIFDQDGWLHTGDIGAILYENKALKVIDRKYNCFKLAEGEYIAPEKIESVYLNSPFVSQVFVYGSSLETFIVAVVIPDEDYIRKAWMRPEKNIRDKKFSEICEMPDIKNIVMQSMIEKGRENKLMGFEIVKKIHLDSVLWTTDDMLTPTQKLRRYMAKQKYQEILNKMYSEEQNI
ncbi:hypothetical protein SteCoe_32541 [Stentor coeruleus]|uniref:AMP-dependent synthetase/ligase domain-containing protein n=1 Tax=Stentor coeruleus TaxID=5963 RepID=A0A1R2AYT1_9CILI|nr:hypothetical protein SteCoe_32541 [Stentor coeruleus]